jgi:hypothetical protein
MSQQQSSTVSAVMMKYINFAKGWQQRHVTLDTAVGGGRGKGMLCTCEVDRLGLPQTATTKQVDIRGATLSLADRNETEFTVHLADNSDLQLRCENSQEREFWCSMFDGVGVRRGGPATGSSGVLGRRGSVMLAKGKQSVMQMGSSELLREMSDGARKAASGAAALARQATTVTHDVGGIQVQLGEQLAEGGYSFVHVAHEVGGDERRFAAKRMVMMGGESSRSARHEVDVLRQLQGHRNIMKVFSHASLRLKREGSTEMVLLCELCEGGHLWNWYVRQHGGEKYDERTGRKAPEGEVLGVFGQCLEAVGHLHAQSPPIAHRDIKIENFLLTRDGIVKLCDFGSATTRAQTYSSRKEILDEEETIQKHSTMMYRCVLAVAALPPLPALPFVLRGPSRACKSARGRAGRLGGLPRTLCTRHTRSLTLASTGLWLLPVAAACGWGWQSAGDGGPVLGPAGVRGGRCLGPG